MKRFYSFVMMLMGVLALNAQNVKYVGGDVSLIPSYEDSKTVYLDKNGNKITDLLQWMKNECGWNCFRVRLFVNPQKLANDGKTWDPAVCQNLDYVTKLGARIKALGAYFMLDIHYSDTYVDATHIQAPAECNAMTTAQKAEWMTTYTTSVLDTLKKYQATPDLVQVGNEIMYGIMGVQVHPYNYNGDDWDGYISMIKNGCEAVRNVCPDAQIIIHTDRPTNSNYNKYYYQKLIDGGVDFDIIGLSYYPFWHGWISTQDGKNDLSASIKQLNKDFPEKRVQIVETAYYFQYWPTSGINYNTQSAWAATPDGQYKFVKDLVYYMGLLDNVDGINYWCPEEAGCGDNANWTTKAGVVLSAWINRGLWQEDKTQHGNLWGHFPLDSANVHYELGKYLNPTDISKVHENVNNQTTTINRTYNLSGQLVNNNYNGIVIRNGKKIMQQ